MNKFNTANYLITVLILSLLLLHGCVGGTSSDIATQKKRKGGLSRKVVHSTIKSYISEVSECYEEALITKNDILGKIVFQWTINMNGDVEDIIVKNSTLNDNKLVSICIISKIEHWKFPKPFGGKVIIKYPFVLDKSGF